ncbi:MAG: hypothetical protein A3F84_26730 [Candidatus Handelsmanbacteria bacterium RIFCSPLOWO2_12_FULL_64_10]|uniref:Uncharacterized protein n=1 Tax=Handelsmanbacteria sp. (strain RIFCSPLOWO2_12_FULL_64_10) TaxID=1817868 RepID=A0A1F6CJQ8_HANXR|nr:MAG: hypothetical protein A3F84_26730 [Candidatus Handelsmanbacteria bacterium RIFCSPLOWO2_12_FULL_64_10]
MKERKWVWLMGGMMAALLVGLWLPPRADGAGVDSTDASADTTVPADTVAAPSMPLPASRPSPASGPQQASNLLNPNVSVIGHFQGRVGDDLAEGERAFSFREAELGLQAPVDPYARADFFVAVSPEEGVDLEEGYLTFLALPGGVSAKVGKFRANLGKFNRTHPPETPFADRPLSAEAFWGEEGLAGTGLSVSALIPNRWVYLNLDAEVTNTYEGAPAFGEEGPDGEVQAGGGKRDLGYLGRLSAYFDLGESANLTLGASYATGVHDPAGRERAHVENADVTFRWKNPRRAIYRSLVWQTEVLFSQRRVAGGGWAARRGMFSYVDWQCARRWHVGGRFDTTEFPEIAGSEKGWVGFLTFTPSEFSLISGQLRGVRRMDGSWERAGLLKLTFNIGPHGAHPF